FEFITNTLPSGLTSGAIVSDRGPRPPGLPLSREHLPKQSEPGFESLSEPLGPADLRRFDEPTIPPPAQRLVRFPGRPVSLQQLTNPFQRKCNRLPLGKHDLHTHECASLRLTRCRRKKSRLSAILRNTVENHSTPPAGRRAPSCSETAASSRS